MRYRSWAPALLAFPALLLAACASSTTPSASSGSGSSAPAAANQSTMSAKPAASQNSGMMASTATVMKVKTAIGPVLADSKGLTLYWFSKDTRMTSACTGGCATAWPPLVGKPMAAMGVRLTGKLGTITRAGGILQASYKGHPLYTYAGDMAPGQTKGNGVGGVWHVLRVNGITAVMPGSIMMNSSPTPAASMSSSSSGGGYGGGGY